MQQQAMQNAQGMSVAPQVGQGTAAATMAGMGGLGVAGQANPYGFQNQVGGYMNPYMNQIADGFGSSVSGGQSSVRHCW